MPRRTLESLGGLVRDNRGQKKLRETAAEIGISPSTLMRVENGRIPDIDTFGKLCHWLQLEPGSFLGFPHKDDRVAETATPFTSIAAHYKTDQNPKRETVEALAQMMLLAMQMQPEGPIE